MRLVINGDGQGVSVNLHLTWHTVRALITAGAALLSMPAVVQLGATFGWW